MFGIKFGTDWEKECEILAAKVKEQDEVLMNMNKLIHVLTGLMEKREVVFEEITDGNKEILAIVRKILG